VDVHQATISVAVRDAAGSGDGVDRRNESSDYPAIHQGIHGSYGTFGKETSAAWLYDLLQLHVARWSYAIAEERSTESRQQE